MTMEMVAELQGRETSPELAGVEFNLNVWLDVKVLVEDELRRLN